MKNVNEFGLFCRKLRIDNNQTLKDMANLLDVSSSYLSAVENGKRNIPENWFEKISDTYCLNNDERNNLLNIVKSQDLQFNDMFSSEDFATKQLLISFARKCQEKDLTPEKIDMILKIMEGDNNESTSKK